jgi:hypothetical protein
MTLDKRALEAVDQLWSAVTALAPAKGISALMSIVKFDEAAEEATKNPRVRDAFAAMGVGFDVNKVNLSGAAKARPFVSPMAWALFSAYQAVALQAVIKVQILRSGAPAKLLDKGNVANLVKAALPYQAEYIDKYGDAGYHYLLGDLEEALLGALRKMLAGEESDRASVERAGEILKLANELTANQSNVPHVGLQGTP